MAAASRSPAFALLYASLLLLLAGAAASGDMPLMTDRFHAWRAAYNRTYATAEERQRRFEVYRRNVEYIEATNRRGELSYELGENQFTDLTREEFLAKHTMPPGQALAARDAVMRQLINTTRAGLVAERGGNGSYSDDAFGQVPYSVDWRTSGAVTPVKHQMNCGSCWAFAAVAAIESVYNLRSGRLVSLSEQELVYCDHTPPDSGCVGGDPASAMWWVTRKGGLATTWEYPYESRQGQCRRGRVRVGGIRGGAGVEPNSEAALERAVARQPGGVLLGPCDAGTNHAVTVVGYSIIKNSWGDGWGEGGYVRMEGRVGAREGLCGIASMPCYPVM
ncbi:LOW QUALITY PROTEIN: hypothetical protein SETIT_2G376300v2 [Setaria italica]|uniref:Cathepsin propeptide inhibitor domain-containing protein n=2 Tax=Setaria italica TaxID=4555 RepID=A0A368Q7Z2_SETIT|nr:LOW QUALITY PROTEIN: hypothetical protein SETIT_2G376300v2 [Setaria italica]